MKRFLALTIVLTAACGLTQNASAGSDRMESKDKVVQPVAPPECDWTGFYIGGNIGWRGGESIWWDKSDSPEGNGNIGEAVSRHDESGLIGGGVLGYNRQINSWFVIGVEVGGSWSGLDSDQTYNEVGVETKHFKTENDWSITFALRMGVTAMNNKLFVFGKVGGAVTHWNYEYINDESQTAGTTEIDRFKADETRISPMVGAGIEYSINCHWSARVDWTHIFAGREGNSGTLVEDFEPDEPFRADIQQQWDSFTAGISYKF